MPDLSPPKQVDRILWQTDEERRSWGVVNPPLRLVMRTAGDLTEPMLFKLEADQWVQILEAPPYVLGVALNQTLQAGLVRGRNAGIDEERARVLDIFDHVTMFVDYSLDRMREWFVGGKKIESAMGGPVDADAEERAKLERHNVSYS